MKAFYTKPIPDELIPAMNFIIEQGTWAKDKFYKFINHRLNDIYFHHITIDLMYTKNVFHAFYVTALELIYGILYKVKDILSAYAKFLRKIQTRRRNK